MRTKITWHKDAMLQNSASLSAVKLLAVKLTGVALITAIVMILGGQPALAQSDGRVDPLSEEEMRSALSAALQAGAANGADAQVSAAALRQEILLVERHQNNKGEVKSASAARQGDVYIYDYATDTLKRSIVNLDTGETNSVEEMQNVQLPLTEAEINRALDLVFADENMRKELQDSYRLITGNELTGIEQLNVKAFVFLAESMPDSVNELSQSCGLHRCAQLLLYTDDDTILEIQPIVDLSRGIVTQDIASKTPFIPDDLVASDEMNIPNEALAADQVMMSNENIEETTADLSDRQNGAEQVAQGQQRGMIFLPYIGRNQFKDQQQEGASLTLDQQIFSWWCFLFGDTFIDDLFGNACEQ